MAWCDVCLCSCCHQKPSGVRSRTPSRDEEEGSKCTSRLDTLLCPFLSILAFMSIVAGVLMWEILLKEHLSAKDFIETQCQVTSTVQIKEDHHCQRCLSVGHGSHMDCYRSAFPCVQVWVRFTTLNGSEATGVLHSSGTQLREPSDAECSESVCNRQSSSNKEFIDRFLSQWPLNHVSSCAYNPENPNEVLVDIHYTQAEAIHAILWPSLVFVISMIVLIVRCCKGTDPCAQKVKQWDPVTLRTLKESCIRKCSCLCPCCKPKDLDEDSPTDETRGGGHENIAFDKF